MSAQNHRYTEPPELRFFEENRAKYPPEELAKYAGRHVAWSPDGMRILTSAATEEEVEAQLRAAGIAPNQVVGEFIPSQDRVLL